MHTDNSMDIISSTFESHGVRLRKGHLGDYYPGSCDQCQMKKMGFKTILYGLTPALSILICDKCYEDARIIIEKTIQHLQSVTCYTLVMGQMQGRNEGFRFVDDKGHIQEGWILHPGYLMFILQDGAAYIPLWRGEEKWISLRNFIIMNDMALFSKKKK